MNTISRSASICSLCLLLPVSQGLAQTVEPTIKSAMRTPDLAPLKYLTQQSDDDFTVTDISGTAGRRTPLNIVSINNLSEDDLFEITGIPAEAALTAGERYNDFWLLRRKELPSLAIVTPEGFSRKFTIAITRTGGSNRLPFTRSMAISVSTGAVGASVIEASPAASAAPARYVRSHSETDMFEKAYVKFKQGDVAGARAIFEFLAAKGDAEAAAAMGETFDPIVLQQLYIKGLTPDPAAAAAWYKKAQQLGDTKSRLNALSQK